MGPIIYHILLVCGINVMCLNSGNIGIKALGSSALKVIGLRLGLDIRVQKTVSAVGKQAKGT